MKDERLDILLEHLIEEKKYKFMDCRYYATDHNDCKVCIKRTKDGLPTWTNCGGKVFKCELEN